MGKEGSGSCWVCRLKLRTNHSAAAHIYHQRFSASPPPLISKVCGTPDQLASQPGLTEHESFSVFPFWMAIHGMGQHGMCHEQWRLKEVMLFAAMFDEVSVPSWAARVKWTNKLAEYRAIAQAGSEGVTFLQPRR